MEYYLKGQNKEFGPYTKIKMLKMVDDGTISMESRVRSQMLKEWKKARSFSFLKEAIKRRLIANGEEYIEENTAYENKFTPVPAGGIIRMMIFLTEILVSLVLATFFLWLTLGYAKVKGAQATPTIAEYKATTGRDSIRRVPEKLTKKRVIVNTKRGPTKSDDEMSNLVRGTIWKYKKANGEIEKFVAIDLTEKQACWAPVDSVNSLLTFFCCLWTVLYFGLSLTLFALRSQTIGMWFWGVFLVKYDEEETLEPITADIAYKYYLLNFVVGFTTLVVSLSNPQRRSIQEQITNTWLIKVRSKVVN